MSTNLKLLFFLIIAAFIYEFLPPPIISIGLGIWIIWWVKNRSNQFVTDKKVDTIIGWLLIGGGIGYLMAG